MLTRWTNGRAGFPITLGLALPMTALLAIACAQPETAEGDLTRADTMPMGAPAMTDANVTSVIAFLNTAEIQAGRDAQTRAADAEVRAFGQLMVQDHTAMQRMVDSVAAAEGVSPQAPEMLDAMQQRHQQTLDSLSRMQRGPEYDRAYINAQVDMHREKLSLLREWQHNVQSPGLQAALQNGIPTVESHLQRAEAIQNRLRRR